MKSVDIGNGQVLSIDVQNEGLTGADIADQSGVDTCVRPSDRRALLQGRELARPWDQALAHCANLDLRLPTLGEATELAQTHDLPNVDPVEFFWTDEVITNNNDLLAFAMDELGLRGHSPGNALGDRLRDDADELRGDG